MKTILMLLLAILPSIKNNNSDDDVLTKMYERYSGKWMKSFSFSQTTEMYRNDSLVKTSTWYEHVVYPDKFRIDFGEKALGNAAIFTNDSIYSFKNKMLVRTSVNDENLTFMLGGMYFYPLDTVSAMFKKMGYNTDKNFETIFDNKPVYVLGANDTTEKSNQLWVDKEKLIAVKFISYSNGEKEEGIFKNHKQFENSWSETACDFYINGKLIQKEKYFDCKANENINLKIFDPTHFILLD